MIQNACLQNEVLLLTLQLPVLWAFPEEIQCVWLNNSIKKPHIYCEAFPSSVISVDTPSFRICSSYSYKSSVHYWLQIPTIIAIFCSLSIHIRVEGKWTFVLALVFILIYGILYCFCQLSLFHFFCFHRNKRKESVFHFQVVRLE